MRRIAWTAALAAALLAGTGCRDTGGNDAANEAGDNIAAGNGSDADGGADGDMIMNGTTGSGAETGAGGDVDVDVNLKVPQPSLEVSPDGVTVNTGDDPGVSVTTNGN